MISRATLLELINQILEVPDDISDQQLVELEEEFAELVPHPGGMDLINYPHHWGLNRDASPEEIAEAALSWSGRALAMRVIRVRPHPSLASLRCYEIAAGAEMLTQVVGEEGVQSGQVVAVVLSGCVLRSGIRVTHRFVEGAFSVGFLLGVTKEPEGRDLTSDLCVDEPTQ